MRAASPLYIDAEQSKWRNPITGISRGIRVIAFPPRDDVLDLAAVRSQRGDWDRPDVALADERSKTTLYGPLKPGTVSELQGKRLRITGTFARRGPISGATAHSC